MSWVILLMSTVCTLYFIYFLYIIVRGAIHKGTPIPEVAPCKRIAAVIPARNEALVIPNLIDSLLKQNYPRALYDVYVVPNGCSDTTAEAAQAAGAKVITCAQPVHSKGEVLKYTFEKLMKAPEKYDGFVVFDADNIADANFLQAVNNTLCAGYQAGQGYRDSKNPNDSWVAGCMSIFFWFMNRLYNRPRAAIGMSAPFNGTGILLGRELIAKIGYNTTSLTEDLEMTAQCTLADEKIAWMPDAITYDEQPVKLKDSFIQRRRWAAGMRQCCFRYAPKLLKKAIKEKNKICIDLVIQFSGWLVQLIGLIPGILTAIMLAMQIAEHTDAGVHAAIAVLAWGALSCVLTGAVLVVVICGLEGKLTRERLTEVCSMGLFILLSLIPNTLGSVARSPKWVSIPHVKSVNIDAYEEKPQPLPFEPKETESL
ncbi:MAG: glycosyltransferase family 2 protein [Clostridia bacterium]